MTSFSSLSAWSRDPALMTAWLFRRYQDLFMDLSQIAHHTPLGLADPDLIPGWRFTTAQDFACAAVLMTVDVLRLLKFATLFHCDGTHNRLAFFFNVTVHYHTHAIFDTWMAVPYFASPAYAHEVSWDTVWQTVVLGSKTIPVQHI